MKKFLAFLIPVILLAACSSDEPAPINEGTDLPATSVNKLPGKEEFNTLVHGKTWAYESSCFVDSRGNIFSADIIVPCTGSPSAMYFSDRGCRRALGGYVGMPPYSDWATWEYDTTDGKIIWHNHSSKEYDFYLESVSENEMVVRTSYGILQRNLYEVIQGTVDDCLPEQDTDSYERIVFKVLDEEKVEKYWASFRELN